MAFRKQGWKTLFFFLAVLGPALGDVQPVSLTFFGLYGSPVQPLGLASSTTDAFGFEALGEWNASNYASLGLSFEQVSFYFPGQSFSYPALNIEGRVFPFQNEKGKFSPYVFGGAGLGLSDGGSPQLKTGIGSRVSFIGPLFLDLAAGSHWIQSPGNAQYVDFRAGLSYSLELNPRPTATPTPAPSSTPTPVGTVTLPNPIQSPVASPTPYVVFLPAPSATPTAIPAAITTWAQGKRYYKLGIKAYGNENFALALRYFNYNLSLTRLHIRPYLYANTCAYIGVIYQFHAHKVPDHLQKALASYKRALSIDTTNKIAKKYYRKLKALVAKMAKAKPKPASVLSASTPNAGATPLPPAAKTPAPSATSDTITLN